MFTLPSSPEHYQPIEFPEEFTSLCDYYRNSYLVDPDTEIFTPLADESIQIIQSGLARIREAWSSYTTVGLNPTGEMCGVVFSAKEVVLQSSGWQQHTTFNPMVKFSGYLEGLGAGPILKSRRTAPTDILGQPWLGVYMAPNLSALLPLTTTTFYRLTSPS